METDPFAEITSLLSSIKSSDGQKTLLDHLTEMFKVKLELGDDKKFNDLFEDISIRLKKNGNGKYIDEEAQRNKLFAFLEDFSKNIVKEKELLQVPMNKEEGEEAEPTPVTQTNYVPDYHSLFKQISWSGIGLSEKESYLLKNSLRNLSVKIGNGNIQFFGKIYGTEKDYYIAEGIDIEVGEINYDADQEHRKEDGVNRNTFYVTNDLSEPWVELPDVKPSQIRVARQIRYNFTGNLNREIFTNPHFHGQEQHLLRCQIARIYHGTKLVPSMGHYIIEDPESPFRQLGKAENQKIFKHNDLINMKNWIHYPPGILKEGRVSHFIEVPEDQPDLDPEEFKKKIIMNDPFDKRIKPITEDKQIISNAFTQIKISPWKLTQHYESTVYINPYIKMIDETSPDFDPTQVKDNQLDYSLICIKSLIWPGSYNFYINKEPYFFYFGNGQKFIDTNITGPFVYNSFPSIPGDEEDLPDEPEPTIPPKEEGEGEEGEEGQGGEGEGGEAKEGEEES